MNSRQRRRQRRFELRSGAAWEKALDHVSGMAADYAREVGRLTRSLDRAEMRTADLKKSTDHEIRKLTASLARQTPLVAELQIALRHIAQAVSIVGADPGPMAVADVASANELRQKVLAALKGPQ